MAQQENEEASISDHEITLATFLREGVAPLVCEHKELLRQRMQTLTDFMAALGDVEAWEYGMVPEEDEISPYTEMFESISKIMEVAEEENACTWYRMVRKFFDDQHNLIEDINETKEFFLYCDEYNNPEIPAYLSALAFLQLLRFCISAFSIHINRDGISKEELLHIGELLNAIVRVFSDALNSEPDESEPDQRTPICDIYRTIIFLIELHENAEKEMRFSKICCVAAVYKDHAQWILKRMKEELVYTLFPVGTWNASSGERHLVRSQKKTNTLNIRSLANFLQLWIILVYLARTGRRSGFHTSM